MLKIEPEQLDNVSILVEWYCICLVSIESKKKRKYELNSIVDGVISALHISKSDIQKINNYMSGYTTGIGYSERIIFCANIIELLIRLK